MEEKVVIVTGASSGIGAALSELYVKRGYRVATGARTVRKAKASWPESLTRKRAARYLLKQTSAKKWIAKI
ncbi:MAG: SDR family NAD(P)-dependent oxidoreductase [Bacteroidales bacterium]|nr:SDR family NAD(P)-dependent oxidoreductase [Bacteroidales bacterium]